MTTDDSDDVIDDLLAAYAIDAVSDEERAAIDAMLADRPELTSDIDDFREVASALAETVAEDPPPGLRADVMAAVASTPQDQPVVPLAPVRRGLRPAIFAVAAAVVLAIGFAAALMVLSDDDGGDGFADILTDPDASIVELEGDIAETLRVVYSEDAGASVVEGIGVDQTAADRAYQMWLVADGPPEPLIVFVPDDNGAVLIRVDGLDPTGIVLAVTDEPAAGSDEPTTPILAAST